MMRWPWSERVEAAEARLEAAEVKAGEVEERVTKIEGQWDFIHEQIRRLRAHQAENGFIEKIHRVARGH